MSRIWRPRFATVLLLLVMGLTCHATAKVIAPRVAWEIIGDVFIGVAYFLLGWRTCLNFQSDKAAQQTHEGSEP